MRRSEHAPHSEPRRNVIRGLAIAVAATALANRANGAVAGSTLEISGPGCRFPDAAYGSVDRQYLVVWADYNVGRIVGRLIEGDGALSRGEFSISDAGFGALYPAVAFNAASNEFLVTWDDAGDRGGVIFGQRVRGDGDLVGGNFAIGTIQGGIRSAVAASPAGYLAVYWGPGNPDIEVYGQRVSLSGALLGANFNISNDSAFSGYPAVAYASLGNQFLVTWDHEEGNIHGRRVDAANGFLLGMPVVLTTGGGKDRSCIAYDSVDSRWLVQFNDAANAGYSYDQSARFVNTDGTLSGGIIPLANTTAFEGDTQFGGDVAFDPGSRRFFSSFGTDNGMGGQESLAIGLPHGPQVTLGTGFYTSLNNAVDPDTHRFLTAWEGRVGNAFSVFGRLYAATLAPPLDFAAAPHNQENVLTWRNPADAHFTGTIVRLKTTGYPESPTDGTLVVERSGLPGATDTFTHTERPNWTTHYYSVFAHDRGPNYSLAAFAAATPRPAVLTVSSSDFTAGPDGWALATWQAGNLAPGTVHWDPADRHIVAGGSGVTNNRDSCTREGGQLIKAVSTAGIGNVQVEYDVMATLNAPPTGVLNGSCQLIEGSGEDKLVVSYSITGTNGPWITAQTLSEGVELPTIWIRKLINLAGVPIVSDNPTFALRFQWQFNTAIDVGRLDNIRVLSGAVTAPAPVISVYPAALHRTVPAGANLPNDIIRISNSGQDILNFSVSRNLPWLAVSPTNGTSEGPERTVTISYNTATLGVGEHEARIEVGSALAINSPLILPVRLRVIPPACCWEPFDYYSGALTAIGVPNWTGNATTEIRVDDRRVKISGGSGAVTSRHALSCAGTNGLIGVQLKIREGLGSGDFFWSIYIDDDAATTPANFARWYGGSTIARGRIGNNITADMVLTDGDTWDDLYLKINTAANTSEFFFNGVSYGVLSHGLSPTATVGAIRFERLDRVTAGSDFVLFDELSIGPLDPSPPSLLWSRIGDEIRLAWPATGMGSVLQSTTDFAIWATIPGPFTFIDGSLTFAVPLSGDGRFFRVRKP